METPKVLAVLVPVALPAKLLVLRGGRPVTGPPGAAEVRPVVAA